LNNKDNTLRYLSYAAKISFILYIFFTFWGTKLPFQEKIYDVEDIVTSNIFNQIIYSGLFLVSFFALVFKRSDLFSLIKREKFLTIFLLWCLFSILWSDFPIVSFKRYFQFFTGFIVSAAALLYCDDVDDNMKYFQYVLAAFVIVSIMSVFTIPAALDKQGIWRGLAVGKNSLGQASLVSLIFWFLSFKLANTTWKKILSFAIIFFSLVLLIGSRSGTSIIGFAVLLVVVGLLQIDKIFHPIGMKKSFSTIAIFAFLLIICVSIIFDPEIFNVLPGLIGKDITFTGRTFLWEEILLEVNNHPILGCGFQGYWVVTNENLLKLYEQFVWLPNQAHNGYLDILNELGFIGLIMFILVVINFSLNLPKLEKHFHWQWFLLITLVLNIQETTLIRPQHPTGVLFMFSYLALFVNLAKQDENKLMNKNKKSIY